MTKKNYYAIVKGYNPGIYTQWAGSHGAQAQIEGFHGAVYRGFATLEEARAWYRQAAGEAPPPLNSPHLPDTPTRPLVPDPRTALQAGKVVMFTDGGSLGNPGPGGYGVVINTGIQREELSGGFRLTTNNRMELTACITGLRSLKQPNQVELYSDSRYVVDGITKGWARRWRANHWQRSPTETAENPDLWAELLTLCERHQVRFHWLHGHSGIPENERCDQLAVEAAQQPDLPPDAVFEKSRKSQPSLFDY